MSQTILAKELTLEHLENTFGLRLNSDPDFFREWKEN